LFCFRYQLSDGQEREEKGELQESDGIKIYRVKGSYTFLGTDNLLYEVTFTADERGFKPKISQKFPNESERTEFDVDERIDPQIVKTLLG
jgi:Insect cuticle protein